MWLFTRYGFFSVVQHKNNPDLVIVRARERRDIKWLENFINEARADIPSHLMATVQETANSDYRFRIVATREEYQDLLKHLGDELDYTNFKDTVHGDPVRDNAYTEVWQTMRNFQATKARPKTAASQPHLVWPLNEL